MILKRFYDDNLAQASYLVGCSATGEALVIDPNRDSAEYLGAAAAEGMRITAVTETHIHADFESGSRELARRAGARLYLSAEGGADWQYAFAESDGATLVHDGDTIRVGNVRFDVMHTPGHTPEHISFLMTDEPASPEPLGAFTGDFIFVGDVGRPDLLERAANVGGTMEPGARDLYRSLQRFRRLPPHLLIWPAHGAGSACGKSLGGVPVSSLGYELLANWAFQVPDEDVFVKAVLAGQPEPPAYFAQMKHVNKTGPAMLDGFKVPAQLGDDQVTGLLEQDQVVVDIRPAHAYAAGHIPGTLSIPLNKSFTNWAGWLLPYDAPIHLLADDERQARSAVRDLAMIGLDDVAGWFSRTALNAYTQHGGTLGVLPQVRATDLDRLMIEEDALLIDVRGTSEWLEGHIPGATHIPLGYLAGRIQELPDGRMIVVQCRSGARSAIGASLLARMGYRNVVNLAGGIRDYERRGMPVSMEP